MGLLADHVAEAFSGGALEGFGGIKERFDD